LPNDVRKQDKAALAVGAAQGERAAGEGLAGAKTARTVPGPGRYLKAKAALAGSLLVWATKSMPRLVDFRLSGEEHIHEAVGQGRPIIFAGWHGHNFLTMLSYYTHVRHRIKGTIMVPDSWNGMAMDRVGKGIDLAVIKVGAELGPSQWARATVSMIKLIRSGRCALLSPDGPEGPAYEVKPGIAVIGQQTKAVIIPASAAASRSVRLRSRWDEHLIPLPLSRAVVHFGAPIDTSPTDGPAPSAEELQERIKAALAEGAGKAEELAGGSAVRKGVIR